MDLAPNELKLFHDHVLSEYPKEACGLVIDSKYHVCHNAAANPLTDFRITAAELLKHTSHGAVIQAVLHSHPRGPTFPTDRDPEWPSHTDMVNWIAGRRPWGIISTDGVGVSDILWLDDSRRAPLLDRKFIHGVQDCYSLVRDYFLLEKGIDLPNFPRGWDWWSHGEDHYMKNFKQAGFKPIDRKDARPGDCILYKIRGPVVHHAAVITGDNTILHHLTRRRSCYQARSDWARFEVMTVRHE